MLQTIVHPRGRIGFRIVIVSVFVIIKRQRGDSGEFDWHFAGAQEIEAIFSPDEEEASAKSRAFFEERRAVGGASPR